jgi:hypothetical protein
MAMLHGHANHCPLDSHYCRIRTQRRSAWRHHALTGIQSFGRCQARAARLAVTPQAPTNKQSVRNHVLRRDFIDGDAIAEAFGIEPRRLLFFDRRRNDNFQINISLKKCLPCRALPRPDKPRPARPRLPSLASPGLAQPCHAAPAMPSHARPCHAAPSHAYQEQSTTRGAPRFPLVHP